MPNDNDRRPKQQFPEIVSVLYSYTYVEIPFKNILCSLVHNTL